MSCPFKYVGFTYTKKRGIGSYYSLVKLPDLKTNITTFKSELFRY